MTRATNIGGFRAVAILLVAVCANPQTGFGATWQWDGGAGTGNWQTDANWSPDADNNDFNATYANRLNVNGAQELVYSSAEGDTVYTFDRGLVVGSGALGSGTFRITGGSFSTAGATGVPAIGNGANTGTMIIDGGSYLSGTPGLSLGIGGGPNSILTLNGGSATISTLTLNNTNGTINLNGGTLTASTVTITAGTNRINFNGGTYKLGAGTAGFSTFNSANVLSGGAIIDTNGFDATIGQALSDGGGGGGLTKNGSGALTLSGAANTFTGTTTINAGTLILNKAASTTSIVGNVTIGDNGTGSDILRVSANEQIANSSVVSFTSGLSGNSAFLQLAGGVTETVGGITTTLAGRAPVIEVSSAGTGTLVVNDASSRTYDGILRNGSGTLAFTKQGAGNLTLQNTGGVAATDFSGATTISGGTLTLGSTAGATGNKLVVQNWSSAITNNSALVLDNATGLSETFGQAIGGTGTLTKSGAGTVTLGVNNTYTGVSTINGGTLSIAADGANGAASSRLGAVPASATPGHLVMNGGTLNFSAGTTYASNRGVLVNASGGTFNATSGTSTINAIIDGAGAVTFNGSFILGGVNTYTGGTTLSGGTGFTTVITNAGAFGGGSGGTVSLNTIGLRATTGGDITIVNPVQLDGTLRAVTLASEKSLIFSGAATLTGNRTITAELGSTDASKKLVFSGAVGDGGGGYGITKDGTGNLVLSGNNTYGGLTTVSAGILNIRHNNALGSTAGGTTVNTGAKLQLEGTNLVVPENLTLGTGGAGATVENVSGNNTLSGTITRNGALYFNSLAGKLTVQSNIGNTNNSVNLQGAGDGEISGGITLAFSVVKTGAGTWTLSGNNAYTGLTSTSDGTLALTGNNSVARVDVNGGTFQVTGGTTSLSSYLTVNTTGSTGTFFQSGGTVQLTHGTNGAYVGNSGSPDSIFTMTGGTFTVAGTEGFRMRAGGTSTTSISGGALLSASGTNGLYFNKSSGSATFNLGDGSTFVGGTSGTLAVSKLWRDAGSSNTFNFNGGTLKATASSASFFANDANLTTLVKAAGGIVDNGGFAITIGEQLAEDGGSPGGGLTFKGSGTTTLSGANSYAGLTTVSGGAGVIVQNASALGTTASGVTVSDGAHLAVQNGVTVTGESVTINGDGGDFFGALRAVGSGTAEWAGNVVVGSDLARIGTESYASLIVSGVISGGAGLRLDIRKEYYSVGEVAFTNANTYEGETRVVYGTLNIQNNNALGTTTAGTRVMRGDSNNLYATLGLSNNITVTGETLTLEARQGVITNYPHLANLSGDNTWAGPIQTDVGGVYFNIESQSGTLTLSGPLNNSLTGSRIWTFGGAAEGTVSGVIGGGAQAGAQVTKKGVGTWTFSNANIYSGTTVVNEGILRLGTNTAAGSGTLRLNGGRLTSDANPRALSNLVLLTQNSAIGSTAAGFEGGITLNGNMQLVGDSYVVRTLTVDSPVEIAGTVTSSGSFSLAGINKDGSSTLTLSGAGDWTGDTFVSAGTFQVTGSASIPSGGNLTAQTGGVFRINTTGQVASPSTIIYDTSSILLEAGTLRTNSITMGGSGTFNWSGGTIGVYSRVSFAGGSDVSGSPSPQVRLGRQLTVNASLATPANSELDLGDLYLAGTVAYNQISISGSLTLGANTTLRAIESPYLLRPSNGGSPYDWGTLVLVDTTTGIFNPENLNFISPVSDGRPFVEYTGSWPLSGDPQDLPANTWHLEVTGTQVLFHYHVSASIPEPSAAGLACMGAFLLRALRRRMLSPGC